MMHKELRAMIICVWYDYFNIMHILAAVIALASLGSLCTRPRLRQHIKRGGGNCSVSDIIMDNCFSAHLTTYHHTYPQ